VAFLPAVIEIQDSTGRRINLPNAQGVSQPIVLKVGSNLITSCRQLPSGLTEVSLDAPGGAFALELRDENDVTISSSVHRIYLTGGDPVETAPGDVALTIPDAIPLRFTGNGVTGSIEPLSLDLADGLNGSYNTLTRVLTVTSTATASSFHAPVHAVTLRNLASVTGGLAPPDTWQPFADYDGDSLEIDNGTRVGVWNQTDTSENSVYVYDSTGNRLVRSTEVVAVGHMIPVQTGRVWAGSVWLATEALESSYTYEPQLGAPTHASWTSVVIGELPGGGTFEDRWVNLLSIPGSDLRRQNLDIELIASGVAGDGTQVRYHKFACYNGNPAGAMFPVGDALGNATNSCLDEPWIDPLVARIRARQLGGNLLIDGLRDILADDDPKHWRYSVEATVKIRLVGEEPVS
jgi:hypothetical protein